MKKETRTKLGDQHVIELEFSEEQGSPYQSLTLHATAPCRVEALSSVLLQIESMLENLSSARAKLLDERRDLICETGGSSTANPLKQFVDGMPPQLIQQLPPEFWQYVTECGKPTAPTPPDSKHLGH